MEFRLWIVFLLWLASLNPTTPPPPVAHTDRLGVGIAWQRGDEWAADSLAKLDEPLWYNWIYDHMDDPRYTPMAYACRDNMFGEYSAAAQANPGRMWLLCNEPEMAGSAVSPQVVAQFVTRWENEVGGPYACCGNIVGEAGLAWMTEYLEAGGPVPPYWHIHIYFADTPQEWQASLDAFEAWMDVRSVDRPIVVSETGYTNPVGGDARPLMQHVANKLEDGTLSRVYWYSDIDYHGQWMFTNLFTLDGQYLTNLGQKFVELTGD